MSDVDGGTMNDRQRLRAGAVPMWSFSATGLSGLAGGSLHEISGRHYVWEAGRTESGGGAASLRFFVRSGQGQKANT